MPELNSTGTTTRPWQAGDELLAVVEGGASPDSLARLTSIPWTLITGAPSLFSGSWNDLVDKPASFPPATHGHDIGDVTGLSGALAAKQDDLGFTPQDAAQKGVAGGYAGLDGTGKVPAAQLPSYVDDVIEAATFAALPVSGETGKLYVTLNDNRTWRWSGSVYVEISPSPGSTDAVPEGATNLYHTTARVRATDLTGYAAAGSRIALAAGDTILGAFNKVGKWLSDLAAVAFSGSASDLTTGTLDPARIADTALTGAKLADATVGNNKLANIATGRIRGRIAAGTGQQQDLTGTEVTTLLDPFTVALKGVVPAPGTSSNRFLRDTGSWAALTAGLISDFSEAVDDEVASLLVAGANITLTYDDVANTLTIAATAGGGGSPGGATGEIQFNNAGAFAGAADVEIEGGQLRLPYVSTPSTPAAGGLKLYGADVGGGTPAFLLPNGRVKLVQSDLGDFNVRRFTPVPSSNSVALETSISFASSGTVTASGQPNVSNLFDWLPRLEWLVTTASTTAIAGWRPSANARYLRVGRSAGAPGGFLYRQLWGPATGVATATNRCFVGVLDAQSAPTDVEPSTRLNMVGMGWDAADTNIQIMHNDSTGTATKIDLGASFPVPTVDRTSVYELQLYSPNSLTQSVSYRVIRYNVSDKTIAAEATGTLATNLPTVGAFMGPVGYISVGGTSSVIGIANFGIYTATEY